MSLPFLLWISVVFKPHVKMVQLVVRIVLKANRRRRHPLGMLLCNSLLRNARNLQLLTLPQLSKQAPHALGIRDDGIPNRARMSSIHHQISRVDLHNLVAGALCVKRKADGAVLAVLFAVAVAGVVELGDAPGVEGDEAQSVCDEFVGQHRAVDLDFYQVDGDCRYFGLDDSPQGVGKGQVRF